MAAKTKIINILPVSMSVIVNKQSPMFNLIGIEDAYVDYDILGNTCHNFKIYFKKLELLRERSSNFDKDVEDLANTLGVNINSHLRFYIRDNRQNVLNYVKSFRKNISHLKSSPIVSLNHEINIQNIDNFREKIVVQEISEFNEILGIANISFFAKTININNESLI